MTQLYGFCLLYVIPGIAGWVFWRYPIKRLIAGWTGRDVMVSLIPKPKDVHHLERITGIVKREP